MVKTTVMHRKSCINSRDIEGNTLKITILMKTYAGNTKMIFSGISKCFFTLKLADQAKKCKTGLTSDPMYRGSIEIFGQNQCRIWITHTS